MDDTTVYNAELYTVHTFKCVSIEVSLVRQVMSKKKKKKPDTSIQLHVEDGWNSYHSN